jgi:cytochrome c-type protein NapB
MPACALTANAADLDEIRGSTPLTAASAPPVPGEKTSADRQPRAFYDQPPVIPHSIAGYRIDASTNKCLSCHSRAPRTDAAAPTLSIAHFLDRNGQASASVAPGHYFCTECHVPQANASPLIRNNYQVLTTVPFRRYLCMECHRPQTGLTSPAGTALHDGDGHAR